MVHGSSWWFLVVLGGSLWFLVVFVVCKIFVICGYWWFLVVLGFFCRSY